MTKFVIEYLHSNKGGAFFWHPVMRARIWPVGMNWEFASEADAIAEAEKIIASHEAASWENPVIPLRVIETRHTGRHVVWFDPRKSASMKVAAVGGGFR